MQDASGSEQQDLANPLSDATGEGDVDFSDCTILIVDDNAQNIELLQAYLESLPCHIMTASDGVEAIQVIDNADSPTPDLLLLDVMMPRMSGFEVCRKIKEDPATRSIPIIMVNKITPGRNSLPKVWCRVQSAMALP